jgi:phage gp29-like protein
MTGSFKLINERENTTVLEPESNLNQAKAHSIPEVNAIYQEQNRLKHYPDTVPNPNILFNTASTGMRVDTVQFYKMLVRKDPQFRTVVNLRKLAVVSAEWEITPADDSNLSMGLANFVDDMFKHHLSSFRKNMREMMDAIVTGYTVQEILTTIDEKGNEVLKALLYRKPDRFEFGSDGEFYLIRPNRLKPKRLNRRHFLIHTNEATPENPYGESVLGEASFWLYYLKNGNWKDWAQFNERFGQGILKGEYERGNIKAMEQTFDALRMLRSNGYAVFEKGSNVEILEASRNAGDYRSFLNEIDRAIAKMILGQELTTSTGSGSSSYSLGKVHQSTFDSIVRSDRLNLEETINSLIREILSRTFKSQHKMPRFRFIQNDGANGE